MIETGGSLPHYGSCRSAAAIVACGMPQTTFFFFFCTCAKAVKLFQTLLSLSLCRPFCFPSLCFFLLLFDSTLSSSGPSCGRTGTSSPPPTSSTTSWRRLSGRARTMRRRRRWSTWPARSPGECRRRARVRVNMTCLGVFIHATLVVLLAWHAMLAPSRSHASPAEFLGIYATLISFLDKRVLCPGQRGCARVE